MTTNIIPLQKWHYALIVRVVMDGMRCHHTAIIECIVRSPVFSIVQLQGLFDIKTERDWLRSSTDSWGAAVRDIEQKIGALSDRSKLDPTGYFLTVRPRYDEIEVLRYKRRIADAANKTA
jgi:hypothetical protein